MTGTWKQRLPSTDGITDSHIKRSQPAASFRVGCHCPRPLTWLREPPTRTYARSYVLIAGRVPTASGLRGSPNSDRLLGEWPPDFSPPAGAANEGACDLAR